MHVKAIEVVLEFRRVADRLGHVVPVVHTGESMLFLVDLVRVHASNFKRESPLTYGRRKFVEDVVFSLAGIVAFVDKFAAVLATDRSLRKRIVDDQCLGERHHRKRQQRK